MLDAALPEHSVDGYEGICIEMQLVFFVFVCLFLALFALRTFFFLLSKLQ